MLLASDEYEVKDAEMSFTYPVRMMLVTSEFIKKSVTVIAAADGLPAVIDISLTVG